VAQMGETTNAHKILVRKRKGRDLGSIGAYHERTLITFILLRTGSNGVLL